MYNIFIEAKQNLISTKAFQPNRTVQNRNTVLHVAVFSFNIFNIIHWNDDVMVLAKKYPSIYLCTLVSDIVLFDLIILFF